MPLNYSAAKNWQIPDLAQRYDVKDAILYNLGIGAGLIDDPDETDLDFVWEKRIKALPTIVGVLAAQDPTWMDDARLSITRTAIVHGEECTHWHAAIRPSGLVQSRSVVDEIYDLGIGRGALLVLRRELYDSADGRHLASIRSALFLRADGGFGGRAPPPNLAALRARARSADLVLTLRTRPEQALIYRLSGDFNPIHISPECAQKAGFSKPILHGLATYGIAAFALIRAVCDGNPERLHRLDARFTFPVLPGQTLTMEIWKGAEKASVDFRCRVADRVVLDYGLATIGDPLCGQGCAQPNVECTT